MPSLDTEKKIIDAAAVIFSKQGYARTTTRAIAAKAGVNEVTLFRRFASKENIFAEVIDRLGGKAITHSLQTRLTGDLRGDLIIIGTRFLRELLEKKDALQLLFREASHFPKLREIIARNPQELRGFLADYLREKQRKGACKEGDPAVMAQAFIGMFFTFAIAKGILSDSSIGTMTAESVTGPFVDIFLSGIRKETHHETLH